MIAASVIVFVLCTSSATLLAQSPKNRWQDLGFSHLPDDYSTAEIPLIEGLQSSLGSWSFKGKQREGEATQAVEGSLSVAGNPTAGMIPMWKIAWKWSAENSERALNCVLMASPEKEGWDLRLVRIGPLDKKATATTRPTPQMFKGTWSVDARTITWTETGPPGGAPADRSQDSTKPISSFEMLVSAEGKISIQNSQRSSDGQLIESEVIARTGKPPAAPVTLTGKHRFDTATEVLDRRIKPCLPPDAKEISLLSERGGHYARYSIDESSFLKFLDELWAAKKETSAHQRSNMAGEGEPADPDRMAKRFQLAGWKPLKNATVYYSPSKSNGAMTTYYFDREAGQVYHDAGYW